jgi:hypothetical protein
MTCVHDLGQDNYRLLITRRNGLEVLVAGNGSGVQLPSATVSAGRRIAPQLTAEVNQRHGLQAYCLFVPNNVKHIEKDLTVNYAIMESLDPNECPPKGTYWTMRATVPNMLAYGVEAHEAIDEALRQLDEHANERCGSHCAKPGWFTRLFEWVQSQLFPLERKLTGNFQQLNASPNFSLIRFETTGLAVWFKATGGPNTHELSLTAHLARLFPTYIPEVIGIQPSWNGWLSEEASGATLDQLTEIGKWGSVARHLAQLQILSIEKTTELLAAGCKDLALTTLAASISPFLVCARDLMAVQEKKSPPPLSRDQLDSLGDDLNNACAVLQGAALPNTLAHIDFNPGNIIYSPERCVFLDWAEGCVTNPLITFEYLREHFQRSGLHSVDTADVLTDAYLQPWRPLAPSHAINRAMTVSPLLAVFAYAISANALRSLDRFRDSALAGYLRSLTRRMYLEATRLSTGNKRCLA